jgi:transcriptional regulator with XRE-family HTH domain/quercetin dioxygenase-like cupin family protein
LEECVPVFEETAPDYRSLKVGARIRACRKQKGWTLRDMAQQMSISIAALSAIENDRAELDLERLVEISEVLGVRPDALFPRTRSCHFHVVRRSSVEQVAPVTMKIRNLAPTNPLQYHNVIRPLAAPFVGKHIEPFHIKLLPSAEAKFVSHGHEEFFFVLRGDVECLLKTPEGPVRERLGPGDCMYLWSHMPHCLRAAGPEAAESIHLLYSGYGATDGHSGDLAVTTENQRASLTEDIARKVAAFRQREGLTPVQFGRLLKMNARRLSDIERGRKPVSIEMLLRICHHFRKPLEYFLASTLVEKPFYELTRGTTIGGLAMRPRRRVPDGSWSGGEFRPLAPAFGPRGMHPYYVRLGPPPRPGATLHAHHGQEFAYVVKGEVGLVTIVDGRRTSHTLSSGDMCFIDSTVPHRFVGMGVSPFEESSAELIDVFWCPLGESYLFAQDDTGASEPTEQSNAGAISSDATP